MVLGVHRHPRPDAFGPLADGASVLQRDLLAVPGQRLTQCRELQRYLQRPHLGVDGLAAFAQRIEQLQVGLHRRFGVLDLDGVLAEVVDGHCPAGITQLRNGAHDLGHRLAGHEAVDHLTGDRYPLCRAAHPIRPRGGQDDRANDPGKHLGHCQASMWG